MVRYEVGQILLFNKAVSFFWLHEAEINFSLLWLKFQQDSQEGVGK